MFFSLFYVLKFYFDKTWIFVAVSITWIPQILNNIYRKNKLSMPFMNILLISTNRLFLPVMFINSSCILEVVRIIFSN